MGDVRAKLLILSAPCNSHLEPMPVSSNMASAFRSPRTSFCSNDLEVVSCTQSLPLNQLQKPATFSVAGRIRKPLRIRCALGLPPSGSITTATTISVGVFSTTFNIRRS
jgi:hypothetical protein